MTCCKIFDLFRAKSLQPTGKTGGLLLRFAARHRGGRSRVLSSRGLSREHTKPCQPFGINTWSNSETESVRSERWSHFFNQTYFSDDCLSRVHGYGRHEALLIVYRALPDFWYMEEFRNRVCKEHAMSPAWDPSTQFRKSSGECRIN